MTGGSGDDVFEVTAAEAGTHGDLTIDGGTGSNVVFFDNYEAADATVTPTSGGAATVTFNDGLTVTVSNITTLVFTDGNQNL
jgi:hypothetical protein